MSLRVQTITTLLFDWDGTIVDSHELGLNAFEQSFAALGIAFDHETYRRVYSPNWYSVYEAMGLPEEKWKLADELWIQHYGDQTAQPIPDVKETVGALHKKGYRLGIVSSGSDCRVTREVNELGLAGVFDVVVCNEQMQHKKPHPEGLETALQSLGRRCDESCYIGDSPEDIEMGKRAGTMTVGVRSTYPTSWRLRENKPDLYLESFSELLNHFPTR
jgi:HAD superfamily hydrolase (TIGR01549 family)